MIDVTSEQESMSPEEIIHEIVAKEYGGLSHEELLLIYNKKLKDWYGE